MSRQGSFSSTPLERAMGFTGNRLDRDGENRSETTLGAALADPRASLYLMADGRWLTRPDAEGHGRPDLVFAPEAVAALFDTTQVVLLGHRADGTPRLAARALATPGEETGVVAEGLRALAMGGAIDSETEGELGQAEHFLNWHARSAFCGRCGTATLPDAAGYRRRCPSCGDVLFPRTDPVSIMLIHDGKDRCILGRSARFPERMWSCLAGFVEPGETLEAAVRRETLEEAGVTVGRVDYFASQPWPFPGSLMIGCMALATTTDIVFDRAELEDCRWFDRTEAAAMIEERHPEGLTAPKRFAIAHHLVRAFVEREGEAVSSIR